MPFESLMGKGRLSEKPWKTDAVARLVVSVIISCLAGAIVAMTVRYLGAPHRPSVPSFLAFSGGAFACLVGALVVLLRPWPFENFIYKLLILLLCVYGGFFLMWLADRMVVEKDEIENSMVNMLIGVLALQGAALVLVHFFLREHQVAWAEGFGFGHDRTQAIRMGIIVGLVALPLTWGLQIVSTLVLQALTFHPEQQEAVQILRNTEGWLDRLVLAVVTIIIAPLGEEILFRGILYPFIKRLGYPRVALWFTALLFAAIHLNLATFVPLTFLAIVLIWLYEYTGNLLACIITHSLFNAANFIALYLYQR
jgi:membrane protease YdiL (CAAX protease family)